MEKIIFEAASGASEIGANAYIIEAGGRRLLLDAGARQPGKSSTAAAPAWVQNIARPDTCWISHAHWDHLGGLGALKSRFPRLACFSAPGTRRLAKLALKRAGGRSSNESALAAQLNRVASREYFDPLRYSPSNKSVGADTGAEAKFRAISFPAGHIAGAELLLLEIDRGSTRPFRILYTGDFCGHDQVLRKGALFPQTGADFPVDVMIMEGVLATQKEADSIDYAEQMRGLCESLGGASGHPALVGVARLGSAAEVVAGLLDAGVAHLVHEALEDVLKIAFGAAGRSDALGRLKFVDERGCARGLLAGEAVVAPGEQYGRGTPAGRLLHEVLENPEASVICLNRPYSKSVAGKLLKPAKKKLSGKSIRAHIAHSMLPNHAPRHQLIDAARAVNPARLVLVHGHRSQLFSLKRAIEKAGFSGAIEVPKNGERLRLR